MRRVFIPPSWIDLDQVTFSAEFAMYLTSLGLEQGDHVIVLDDSGWEHEVVLNVDGYEAITGRVVNKTLADGEQRTKITLYQGLMAPEGFEEVIRRGTKLGLVEFIPMVCDHSAVPGLGSYDTAMLEQWRDVILEVAQDSERGRLPRLKPALLFDTALDRVTRRGMALMVVDSEDSRDIRTVTEEKPFLVHLLAPPPEGFTDREVERASRRGVIPMRPPFDPTGDTPHGLLTSQAIFELLG